MVEFGKRGQMDSGPKAPNLAGLNDRELIGALYKSDSSVKAILNSLAELRERADVWGATVLDRKQMKDKETELRTAINGIVGSERGNKLPEPLIDAMADAIIDHNKKFGQKH